MNNPSGYDPKKSSNMAKFGSIFKSGSRAPNPPGEPHEPAALRETVAITSVRQIEAPVAETPARDKPVPPPEVKEPEVREPEVKEAARQARGAAKKARAVAPKPRRKAAKSDAALPPSRQGKVQLTQWVDPIDKQRIDLIVALNLADNKADFIKKAIDLFIEKHGKLPI